MYYVSAAIILVLVTNSLAQDCASREYGKGNIVCVCNATYCDTLPTIDESAPKGTYQMFSTTQSGLRLHKSAGTISSSSKHQPFTVTINRSQTYQKILGFGGAFTDSAGINIAALSSAAQENLLNSYFSKQGSEYNTGRVPIAGTDCSTRPYSYADKPAGTIKYFALQPEDYDFKIPYIKKAMDKTGGELLLYASVWSSPPWMKYNNNFSASFMKPEFYQMWADYIVKFFEAYADNGVNFWAYTLQNEPVPDARRAALNSVIWLTPQLITWLCNNIGPTLKKSPFAKLKIIILDDDRGFVDVVPMYYANATALGYIDGVAFHWYTDAMSPPSLLDVAKTPLKDIFMVYTEACYGPQSVVRGPYLGSWNRGEGYASDIMDVLNYDGVGWTDWNLALNTEGKPNYIGNYLDAAIIVNATADEFLKEPMYYALAQFSKFLPRGSVRMNAKFSAMYDMKTVAFLRLDGKSVVVILNSQNETRTVRIYDRHVGNIYISVEKNSVNTVVYW